MTTSLLRTSVRALCFAAIAASAQADTTDLATAPLITAAAVTTLPNLLFVLDDSGSMAWANMPDASDSNVSVTFDYGYYGLRSSQCNGIYYNPSIVYQPPVYADGTSYPDATFSSAWKDGYKTSSGTVNLSNNFKVEGVYNRLDSSGPLLGGDTTGTAAYYFTYSGTQTSATQKDYNSTTNTFYKECSSAKDTSPGKGVFAKVTVGESEQQNFANWYSYYRTRILAMKTAVGRAFKAFDGHYRVGFLAIDNNTPFVNVSEFAGSQRTAWYNSLYNNTPSGGTPLRVALSTAGRLYAGKLKGTKIGTVYATDPIQYSCQQNFTILSTDGFWNSGGGVKLNGTTAIGNQDGTEIRPYFDGTTATTTRTTPITTVVRNQSVTRKTTSTVWTRYSYTTGINIWMQFR